MPFFYLVLKYPVLSGQMFRFISFIGIYTDGATL